MISVERLWKMALPEGTKLLAGSAGLGREVIWTSILRPRPPAFDLLRTGDLALISLTALGALDPTLPLDRVVSQVAQAGVSGVVVAGRVGEEAAAVAERTGTPLFELPEGSSLTEVDQQIARIIRDWSAEIQRRVQAVQNQLTELALQGRGVKAILDRLAELTEKTVILTDPGLAVRHWSSPRGQDPDREMIEPVLLGLRDDVSAWALGQRFLASDPGHVEFDLAGTGLMLLVAPALAGQRVDGYVGLIGRPAAVWEADALSLRRAAAALAIHLARETAVMAAEDRLQGNLIDDIIEGTYPSVDSILARASRLGFDLTKSHVALALMVEPPDAADEAHVGNVLAGALERGLAGLGLSGPVRQSGRSALALIPVPSPSDPVDLRRTGEKVLREVSGRLRPATVSAGLGRLHPDVEGLRRSGREAEQALSSGRQVFGSGHLTCFADLGIYRLLFAIRDHTELEAFYDDTLGALVDYDHRHKNELVKTLAAYFAAGSSPGEAAGQLHLHRNTLLYRLNRIRTITGLDLDDPDTRLSLHLALKVGEILPSRHQARL
ncbi:MAG TPA: helix-turn-helix domain-containing protein [Dehalococcoidia bacterium]|nr:helix-turn-helix domain-containing protein [Dehalococcoidia bacterium]